LQQINETNFELETCNAFQLFQNDLKRWSIFTFCTQLNSLFEDGFPIEHVIELFGAAGVGKTQIWFV
jgi:hypothetical protein